LGQREIREEIWFFCGFADLSKMLEAKSYKDYLDVNKYNYAVEFDREDLLITNERFIIFDERGEEHFVELYDSYLPNLKFVDLTKVKGL